MHTDLIQKIIEIYTQSPRIAILMSGKGSNANVILKNSHRYKKLNFITICTDRKNSNALKLSEKYGLQYFCLEGKITSVSEREHYFKQLANYLSDNKIDTLLYAGFMKITPEFFVKQFPGINVHPADLTIKNHAGAPKYIGMHAIQDAIYSGESYIASTAHVVDCEVDCGQSILVSRHLTLNSDIVNDLSALHEQLKMNCEHQLFPFVLELLSQGRIFKHELPYKWDDLFNKLKLQDKKFFSEKLLQIYDSTSPLDLAYLAQDYASQVGFDFNNIEQVFDKVKEEFDEMSKAFSKRNDNFDHFVEEIGDCFFSLVNLCRFMPLHPDFVLKKNILKYIKRCTYIENELKNNNKDWSHATSEEMLKMWKKSKENECQ